MHQSIKTKRIGISSDRDWIRQLTKKYSVEFADSAHNRHPAPDALSNEIEKTNARVCVFPLFFTHTTHHGHTAEHYYL